MLIYIERDKNSYVRMKQHEHDVDKEQTNFLLNVSLVSRRLLQPRTVIVVVRTAHTFMKR